MVRQMSKILVLGSGAQGIVTVMWLIKDPEVSEVRLADIDLEKTKKFTNKLKSDKVRPQRVDAWKSKELLEATKGVDVVINSIAAWAGGRSPTLDVMDAALKNGAHYLDVDTAMTAEKDKMLALNDKWKDAGLSAIFDLGKCPGISHILAKYAADKLDQVEGIRIKSCLEVMSEKEFLVLWAPVPAVLGWRSEGGLVYENGVYKELPPFSGAEDYTFPNNPLGPCTGYLVDHEEVRMLPRFIKGVQHVEFKFFSHRMPIFRTLSLLFREDKTINVKGVEMASTNIFKALVPPPGEFPEKVEAGLVDDAYSCPVVEVTGEKAGMKRRYVLSCPLGLKDANNILPNSQPLSIQVGTPPAIISTMLIKKEIKLRGVMPPVCLDPEPLLAKLAEKGIRTYERVEKYIA